VRWWLGAQDGRERRISARARRLSRSPAETSGNPSRVAPEVGLVGLPEANEHPDQVELDLEVLGRPAEARSNAMRAESRLTPVASRPKGGFTKPFSNGFSEANPSCHRPRRNHAPGCSGEMERALRDAQTHFLGQSDLPPRHPKVDSTPRERAPTNQASADSGCSRRTLSALGAAWAKAVAAEFFILLTVGLRQEHEGLLPAGIQVVRGGVRASRSNREGAAVVLGLVERPGAGKEVRNRCRAGRHVATRIRRIGFRTRRRNFDHRDKRCEMSIAGALRRCSAGVVGTQNFASLQHRVDHLIRSLRYLSTWLRSTRSCVILSRSRMVTVSFLSASPCPTVSKSTVTQKGVPISSLPAVALAHGLGLRRIPRKAVQQSW